jgi:16S rRNA (guanine966-N2)-methyltransferase
MRIIGGDLKGKKILLPEDSNTRPLRDMVKESIFNILTHSNKFNVDVKNSKILDLFSGVGSFGIEALSRNAEEITFVENYSKVIEILEKNINNLELHDRCKILKYDIFKEYFYQKLNAEFNIIFIDAPFKEKNINFVIENIRKNNLLNKNGIIILHRKASIQDDFGNDFKIFEKRNYGISTIIFGTYLL